MTEQPALTVRHASVVLVSPSPIAPQSIRQETLSNAGIVPDDWVSTGGISIPVVALTQYQNGVTIQTEGNRCIFQEPIGGALRETYEVHPLAQRYAAATRLVPYNAVGINWLVEVAVGNPNQWIREKLMGNGGGFSDFYPTSLQMAKQLDFAVCNLNVRVENVRIVVDCNYHFQLAPTSPDLLVATLNSWTQCQAHLAGDLLPHL
jgi:hypothetical protein